MVKKICSIPAVQLGFSALVFFYLFYLVNNFLFFTFILSGGILMLFFALKQKMRIKKYQTVFLYLSAGLFAAAFAYYRLCTESAPIKTLADISLTEEILVYLKEDPYPAGSSYHKAKADIIFCRYKDNCEFSATGSLHIFIPSSFIIQNNSGGITVSSFDKQSCRFFVKGIYISAIGKFSERKTDFGGTAFFVNKTKAPRFHAWKNSLAALRGHMRFYLMNLLYAWKEAGGLLLALLSANRDFLSGEFIQLFRNAGQTHVLVLSGMHLSIAVFSASFIAKLFSKKKLAPILSVIFALIFIWFAGASPSLFRALAMMLIIAAGLGLDINPDTIAVMSAVFTIHLILRPADALSFSFMLSYGALSGILIFGKAFYKYFNGKLPPLILSSITASAGAVFFTAPIIILKTESIALIGIAATIIVSPLISLFLVLGIIFIIFAAAVPSLTDFLGLIINFIYKIIFYVISFFSVFPIITANSYLSKTLLCIIFPAVGIIFVVKSELKEKKSIVKLS